MIDHLLCFQNEAAAMAACPRYVNDGGEDGPQWDSSCCIPGVTVAIPTGKFTEPTDEAPAPREIMALVPNETAFWIAIATAEPDPDLMALPQCRVVSDRQAVREGRDHFVFIAADIDFDILSKGVPSPVFAGTRYTF